MTAKPSYKELEKRVIELEKKLSDPLEFEIFETTGFKRHHAVILLVEPVSGAIVDANIAAQEYYGYSIEQLKQMKIQQINTLTPEMIRQKRQQAFEESANYFEFPHRLANGEIRIVEVHSSPIVLKGQKILLSIIHDITLRKNAEEQRDQLIFELKRRLNEIKVLEGFIPICAHCKKIRDDSGYWNKLEEYICKHSEAEFSHGLCPDCEAIHYPEYRGDLNNPLK